MTTKTVSIASMVNSALIHDSGSRHARSFFIRLMLRLLFLSSLLSGVIAALAFQRLPEARVIFNTDAPPLNLASGITLLTGVFSLILLIVVILLGPILISGRRLTNH